MSDYDAARIVPSTRDLFGALASRRKALPLVPLLAGDEATVLRALDEVVRAYAVDAVGPALERAARATATLPALCLTAARSVEECQRARYFGADGVCLPAEGFAALAKTVQSMRMLALALAHDADHAALAVEAGARAVLLHAPVAAIPPVAQRIPRTLLVAWCDDASADDLRRLSGVADAAIAPVAVHRAAGFAALASALDS